MGAGELLGVKNKPTYWNFLGSFQGAERTGGRKGGRRGSLLQTRVVSLDGAEKGPEEGM